MSDAPPAARTGLRGRLLTLGSFAAGAGLLDQVLGSLANLAVGLLVLRYGTKAEFGLYGLGYSAIILATSFSSALFGLPMTVSYYGVAPPERAAYAGALFLGQAVTSVLLALLALGAATAGGFAALGGSAEQQAWLLVILCGPIAMVVGWSRSYRFLLHQGPLVLALNLVHAVTWIGLAALLMASGVAAHLAALGAFGVASAVAAVLGLIRGGLVFGGARQVAAVMRSVWDQARWAMVGVLVGSLQNQAHLYLLAVLASLEAVAEVNAARMLVSPVGMVVIGLNRGMLPVLAKLHAEGRQGDLRRMAAGSLLFIVVLTIGGLAALFASWDLLAAHVLRGNYAHVGPLVAAWALVITVQAVNLILAAQLQVRGDFRLLTLLDLGTAIPMLVVSVPSIWWAGGLGGLLALAAGQAALAVLLGRLVRDGKGARNPVVPVAP